MTSLNTTSGWNAKEQKGSNLTTRRIIQGSGAVAGATGDQRRHLSVEAEEKGKPSTSGGGGGGAGSLGRVVRATPATSVTVTSSVGSTTSTSTTSSRGGALRGSVSDVSSLSPPLSEEEVMRERELFYKEKYDYMTGVRIASTLGGFFLLVLLTLLYKSKCKGKHSREPSTLTLNSIPYPAPGAIHPAHLALMRGQNIQVNGGGGARSHHYHDFGGGGGGGSPGLGGYPPTMTLLDNSGYGYMNQVHPANSHQPSVFSSNNCYSTTRSAGTHMKNPAVLLITAANSESSDEELSELISPEGGGAFLGEVVDIQPPPKHVEVERRRNRSGLGGVGAGPPGRQWSKSPPTILLGPGGGCGGGGPKGNIDINVILPTPSISPSGSENFNVGGGGHGQYFGGGAGATSLFPSIRQSGGGGGGAPPSGRGRLLVSRSLSSENENDQSEDISVGGDGGDGGDHDQLSECSSNISNDGGGNGNAPVPFGCGASSLFSLDNLKYVDDTSSENIPTRGDSEEGDDKEEDTRSIGSDSVFACFEHNFDHVAPTYARRVSSVSGASLQSPYPGSSPLPPPRHHHQHHHHWSHSHHHRLHSHHQHSSIHPPPPPPPQPPHPPIPIINQPPPTEEDTTTSGGEFQVTLTQAQAQVHHHHQHRASSASFCSADLESINDYLETGSAGPSGRRRSSSTQTTLSDLRQALGYSHMAWSSAGGDFNGGGAISPGTISLTSPNPAEPLNRSSARRLSVPRRRRSLSPHLNPGSSPCAHLALSPRNSTSTSQSTSTSPPPPPPQPPTSLHLHLVPTTATANASTTAQPEDFEEEDNLEATPSDNQLQSSQTPVTPTNPPPPQPPTLLVSPSSPFIPPRLMRKRSFDAVRKQLSLQCGSIDIDAGGGDSKAESLYQVSSSNETTPTN